MASFKAYYYHFILKRSSKYYNAATESQPAPIIGNERSFVSLLISALTASWQEFNELLCKRNTHWCFNSLLMYIVSVR